MLYIKERIFFFTLGVKIIVKILPCSNFWSLEEKMSHVAQWKRTRLQCRRCRSLIPRLGRSPGERNGRNEFNIVKYLYNSRPGKDLPLYLILESALSFLGERAILSHSSAISNHVFFLTIFKTWSIVDL